MADTEFNDNESLSQAPSASHGPLSMRRLGAWAGVIGSTIFVSVFTIEGLLRPGYDAASVYISALSIGPGGWIQITNFIVVGLLIVLFANGVAAELGETARTGVTLLTLIGLSLTASGPFVMDLTADSFIQMSTHSKLHYLFGAIVFSLAPASLFVFATRFSGVPFWRALKWWTLAAGIVMVVGIGFLKIAALPSNVFHPWLGLIQRADHRPFLYLGVHCWAGDAQACLT